MVEIRIEYQGGLRCEATHGPSGVKLLTDAPVDNQGRGASFSPTDLVGAALAACALTTIALTATREGLPWGDASATVEKRMSPPPRRIAELIVHFQMPAGLSPELRARYEDIARNCPVARSLHGDVQHPMTFRDPER